MENKSTHFVFDEENIVISPDLSPIIQFLQEIEKEVESLLGFSKKLESIGKQYLETLKLAEALVEKLKENSIDFSFTLSEDPVSIVDKLRLHRPIRSEMIVLFAVLETLFCLNLAYKYKTSDKNKIRKLATNITEVENFLNHYCLSQDNGWIRRNPDRLKDITPIDIRDLRNNLTHFFSVSEKLGIVHPVLSDKAREIERSINKSFKFISPEDLYGIIKGAFEVMIKKWNRDYQDCLRKNSDEFQKAISCVRDIIEKYGVVIVKEEQFNF